MTPFVPPNLLLSFPELLLAGLSLILLMVSVLTKKENYRLVARLSIFALMTIFVVVFKACRASGVSFNGMFVVDVFSTHMKLLVILGSAVSLAMSTRYLEREKINRIEYPILILFSTLGMMLMISANDLMSLYMGLELQSLPLYVLAAMNRDNTKSTEAGIKYFVLGALSSGMLLYGMSLVYGFTGATGFEQIAQSLQGQETFSIGLVTGISFILAGLAFKISAVPFHMWAPDVYEGAPTSVTAFFAIAPKVAAIALITRLFMGPFGDAVDIWRQVIVLISIASMILGSVAAITQTNIKRLLAYSSIGHMGYALVGLAAANEAGVKGLVLYITIYLIMSIGTFCVVLMMKREGKMCESINDLSGLAKQQPMLALAMTVMMFSMAGIPPFAGFFGKLFIFQSAVNAGLYGLTIVGVLTSVIAAYYYLRVIKIMYFKETTTAIDKADDISLKFILLVSSCVVVFFIVYPAPLMNGAAFAAQAFAK